MSLKVPKWFLILSVTAYLGMCWLISFAYDGICSPGEWPTTYVGKWPKTFITRYSTTIRCEAKP